MQRRFECSPELTPHPLPPVTDLPDLPTFNPGPFISELLPRTGTDLLIGVAAAALILAGWLIVTYARRRRAKHR